MKDLIKALQILLKYNNATYPIQCEHDTMIFYVIEPWKVSEDDLAELRELGVERSDEFEDAFISLRFGSC